MEHFFHLIGILILACVTQFFYFNNLISKKVSVNKKSEDDLKTDKELSPENFRNFDYYLEKFNN